MKNKFLLSVILMLMVCGAVSAQGNGKKVKKERMNIEQRAAKESAKMKADAGLSAEQEAKVTSAVLDRMMAMKELKKSYPDKEARKTDDDFMARQKVIRKAYRQELKSILSEDQRKKLKAARKKRKTDKGLFDDQ